MQTDFPSPRKRGEGQGEGRSDFNCIVPAKGNSSWERFSTATGCENIKDVRPSRDSLTP